MKKSPSTANRKAKPATKQARKPATQSAQAAALGITPRTLREWKAAGMTHKEIQQRAALRKLADASPLAAAKLRKIEAEADLREVQVATARRELMPVKAVAELQVFTAALVKAGLSRLAATLPAELEGLPCARMQKIIQAHCDELLQNIHDETAVEGH
jgi:DNA-binding transcriptional MerR regulator